jgi:hypothetical protein
MYEQIGKRGKTTGDKRIAGHFEWPKSIAESGIYPIRDKLHMKKGAMLAFFS